MMPPAARIASAPSGGVGMRAATWARPHAENASAVVPTSRRELALSSLGARRRWTPTASRTRGTAYPTRPKVPATTAWTTVPTAPGIAHHSRAATTTARATKSRPSPSRRCSGSRSRPVSPTLRATEPVAWARPIHVLWTARSGSGSPPERGLRLLVRFAGARRDAGRVVEDRPRAELDVRVAMGAGYARVTRDSRVTRGAGGANRRPQAPGTAAVRAQPVWRGLRRSVAAAFVLRPAAFLAPAVALTARGAAFPVHPTPCGQMHRASWAPLLGAHVEAETLTSAGKNFTNS